MSIETVFTCDCLEGQVSHLVMKEQGWHQLCGFSLNCCPYRHDDEGKQIVTVKQITVLVMVITVVEVKLCVH